MNLHEAYDEAEMQNLIRYVRFIQKNDKVYAS